MIQENRSDTMIKTEKRTNAQKCEMKKKVFDNVHRCSIIHSCILATPAFKVVEDFKSAIQEGPTYISDVCWKFEFRKNVMKLNTLKNQAGICNKFSTGMSGWMWSSSYKSILKNKIPMQTQKNILDHCPKFMSFKAYIQLSWC